jgi:two-component system, chemotaxis family, CheB/CheR fusion protein
VVLSGTGSYGTLSFRAIKEHGGMAMTQDEDSARYREMPPSAYASGLRDYMLAAEGIPAQLIECAEHLSQISDEETADGLRKDSRKTLSYILVLLRSRTGHDSSQYKESTVIHRVERRIQVTKASSPEDYLQRLRNSPTEINQLFNDTLIGVTQFMRDPEVFERLDNDIVPQICGI